ncbi:MAG: hypothetical protein HY300_19250 [Verrucomicrobia bacterium]|nr:hypothetical protein [Verrucomicrobiota bacterium]
MRLFEAILDANHRAVSGDGTASLPLDEFTDALPVVALTCIDARLNPLLPEVLGVPEEKFIWLRNAGNIIFDMTSSMTRTLALACAIKGGREIAIIGHTDCYVGKASILQITDRFRALGIDRAQLPDNLNEFFGLFASERQNVIRGCDFVRRSPLIGAKVPVHGLMLDITNGRLEWIVNGYEGFASSASPAAPVQPANVPAIGMMESPAAQTPAQPSSPAAPMQPSPSFSLGEMKFPETKIGETVADTQKVASTAEKLIGEIKRREFKQAWDTGKELVGEVKETATDAKAAADEAREVVQQVRAMSPVERAVLLGRAIEKARRYTIIGGDRKKYGPISGNKLLEWIADERIDEQTPIQVEGTSVWQTLGSLADPSKPPVAPAEQEQKLKGRLLKKY